MYVFTCQGAVERSERSDPVQLPSYAIEGE